MIVAEQLDPAQRAAAQRLLDEVAEHDGAAPLDEAALLQLRGRASSEGGSHVLALEGERAVGLASILPDGTVQGAVHPDHRRRGHATGLWAHVLELLTGRVPQVWAHGDLDSARGFLTESGLAPVRTLLSMRRSSGEAAPLPDGRPLSGGVELTTFDAERDLDALLAVNAAAFADHPEQGAMDRAAFEARAGEPWFDTEDLHIARVDGELAAFVWIKREKGAPEAEVYVVGTAPWAQGRGLATALLVRALRRLEADGAEHVDLYVEASSAGAVGLYERLGFAVVGRDVQWSQAAPGQPGAGTVREDGSARIADQGSTRAEDTGLVCRPSEPRPEDADLPEDRFFEREASWLAFNARVMELAADPRTPLLERLRFASIVASNLDEFFMVRVAGLKRRLETGMARTGSAGVPPREVLARAREGACALQVRLGRIIDDLLLPELAERADVTIVRWRDLSDADRRSLTEFYTREVAGILTPLAVDPAHPFPYVSGLSLSLIVQLRRTADPSEGRAEPKIRFARVKVPGSLPRYLPVGPDGEVLDDVSGRVRPLRFVALEELIAAHLTALFPGMEVLDTHLFRVTRNQRVHVEEDDDEHILAVYERELSRRRFGAPVRLEVEDDIDPAVRQWLMRALGVHRHEVFALPGPLDPRGLAELAEIEEPALQFGPFVPATHPRLTGPEATPGTDILDAVREGDILLHHPFDSFATSVQAFLEEAAADPDVRAIKATLYRTSGDSPIVRALIAAAEAGKQVLALVEIKARFDEENNISWARKLEEAGAHVVYGIIGLKIHAKVALVVRDEPNGLVRYAHVGTGNYNSRTARHFEDLGLLTADPVVGADIARLFNQLSGYAPDTAYERVLVAPRTVRRDILALIDAEIAHHRAGRPARIRMKMNAIVDEEIIDALYRASQAGVEVQLVIRGVCALKPGVPGLSETISVRSVLGRFLEHSRIYEFAGGGEPRVMIGSPDMMPRNLDRRVEVLVPIADTELRGQLAALLDLLVADTTACWLLQPDGTWRRSPGDGAARRDAHEQLITIHRSRGDSA